MNAALKICQERYDAQLPPPVSESAVEIARNEWLYNAAEQLIGGVDITFQRRMCSPQGVTARQFALVVDEFVNNQLADNQYNRPLLGDLIIDAARGCTVKHEALELLGHSHHALGKLGEIAEALLSPIADDALAAQAEDDEL